MSPVPVFRFFDLPPELRFEILSHLLVSPEGIQVNIFGTGAFADDTGPCSEAELRSLSLVSDQMHQEASDLFFARNHFWLALKYRNTKQLTEDYSFWGPNAQSVRRRVRSLSVYVKNARGDYHHHVMPALSDMALCGALRNLDLRFYSLPGVSDGTPSPDPVRLRRSDCFQAILNLLQDPYLDQARFLVSTGLWARLQSLMPGTSSCPKRSPSDIRAASDFVPWDDSAWEELDCKNLIEAFSTEQKIVKIGERLN